MSKSDKEKYHENPHLKIYYVEHLNKLTIHADPEHPHGLPGSYADALRLNFNPISETFNGVFATLNHIRLSEEKIVPVDRVDRYLMQD